MNEIAPGIHCWTAPHPEWRPSVEEVLSYALLGEGFLIIIDPLLPGDDERRTAILAALDRLAAGVSTIDIAITIPYHARSAEALYHRYAPAAKTAIWGHAAVARRLSGGTPLTPIAAMRNDAGIGRGVPTPSGRNGSGATSIDIAGGRLRAFAIGKPRRFEMPLYSPAHKALAFGDAVVAPDGRLRIWRQSPAKLEWYRDVFVPTLRPLLDLDLEYVLVTHGVPVLHDARVALAEAFTAEPTDF